MASLEADDGRSLAAKWRSRTSICSGVERLRRLRGTPAGGGSKLADASFERRDEPLTLDGGVPGPTLLAAGRRADAVGSGRGRLLPC